MYIKLGDAFGKWSKKTKIDTRLKRGDIDVFHLNLPDMKNMITEVEIRRDNTGAHDEW